jgi:hypothetical protein
MGRIVDAGNRSPKHDIVTFGNPERRHTSINDQSPIEYETRHQAVASVA